MAELKACRGCGVSLPVEDFPTHFAYGKRRPRSYCHDCHRAQVRAYRQRNLEARREREREYARSHAEQKRETARQHYYEHREEKIAYALNRYQEDPGDGAARAMMARARKHGAPEVEYVRREDIIARDGQRCHVCGEDVPDGRLLHLDHVIPLSKGGPHTAANLRVSHARCNLARRGT